jgi:type IV secretory pathway VirB10-like protein
MEQVIQNKAPKPAGLVPKNLQAFVLVGLALLMVLIMALTGRKQHKVPATPNNPALPEPTPVNSGKVADFAKNIEQSEQESAPQAEAALLQLQKQLAAQRSPAQSSPTYLNGSQVTSAYPNGAYPPGAYAAARPQPAEGHPPEDPIKEDGKKRAYLSLFADNIALSYRHEAKTAASPSAGNTTGMNGIPDQNALLQAAAEMARESQMLAQAQPNMLLAQNTGTATPNAISSPSRNIMNDSRAENLPAAHPAAIPNTASGKNYVLFEGTNIDALLINRLEGSFAGPVSCLVSDNIYSHDRQHLLIPAGSKVLGEASKVAALGQTRLAVTFHRLIMPDGYSVSLDQFKGLDQQGATALKDKVNNHYAQIFGASLAVGILGGAGQLGTGNVIDQSAADRMREGFGVSMANSGEDILNRFLNILPTVTIREGSRIKIYLAGDVLLPDYDEHHMPADF